MLLNESTPEWHARDLLGGFSIRDRARTRIGPDDLERHAPLWGRIVPASPRMKAAVAHILATKYRLSYDAFPHVRAALELDSPEVRTAYFEEYGQELMSAFGSDKAKRPNLDLDDDHDSDAEDAAEILARDAEWRFFPGGAIVTQQGSAMDSLYVVASGRLRGDHLITGPSGQPDTREFVKGDVLGNVGVMSDAVWESTIHAARDTELVQFSRDAIDHFFDVHPKHGATLTRALVTRSITPRRKKREAALTTALIPMDPQIRIQTFGAALVEALNMMGPALLIDARDVDDAVTAGASESMPGDDLDGMVASWLSEQESNHRFVVYPAGDPDSAWTRRCLRQADRVVLIARADSDPGVRPVERLINDRAERHLVLIHPADTGQPEGTAAWIGNRSLKLHHHVREGNPSDLIRAARLVVGEGLGLVLGGGGARGYVHAGVVRAFYEEGISPDAIGGTSIGAAAAALRAIGWTYDDYMGLGRRITKRGALFDYTLPLMSLMSTAKITSLLRSLFGDVRIEDLWMPFYCVSTNLTKGEPFVHRTGPLWQAVRASLAVPGIFSPVLHDGDVLVDGAVLNNLPINVMRQICGEGTVVGVQVSQPSDEFDHFSFEQDVSGWKLLWRRIIPMQEKTRIPSIVGILMRSVEIKGISSQHEPPKDVADIIIRPDLTSLKLLDFTAYRAMADVGYQTAKETLKATGLSDNENLPIR